MKPPRTALVIPVFNGRDRLPTCIASLSWAASQNAHLVVVDAGSTDGTREWIRDHAPDVTLLLGSPWMWWTAMVDLGCRYAVDELGVEYLALLNDDCTWDRAGFVAAFRAVDERPRTIVCSHVRDIRSDKACFVGGIVSRSGLITVPPIDPDSPPPPSGYVSWCGGQGVLFAAAVFRDVGGFDPIAFPHYFGDADFCLRAGRLGIRTYLCSESIVLNDTATTGVVVPREGVDVPTVWRSLTSRHSVHNLRDNIRLNVRHGGVRAPLAVAHLLYLVLGWSSVRLLRGFRLWPQ